MSSVSYAYSEDKVWASDDLVSYQYNMLESGKPGKVIEAENNETDYQYDTMGRVTAILQGVQVRTFSYDNLGRLLSETHPEKGTTSYGYDANSNLVTRTDARGITTTYTYDALNRVTMKTYSDGTPSVNNYYDIPQPGHYDHHGKPGRPAGKIDHNHGRGNRLKLLQLLQLLFH